MEKKTLSDKIHLKYYHKGDGCEVVNAKDVRETLKEFINKMIDTESDAIDIRQVAKEVFGKELTKDI